MPFQIMREDITKIEVDAIVNSANTEPIIGKGTDGAIYAAAGKDKLLAVRQKIGVINFGDARVTDAFNLPAKFIIHTVAPIWKGGNFGELKTLRMCYRNSLNLAFECNCESIAFPLLATGINNFPHNEALKIAATEIQNFLFEHDMLVILAVFGKRAHELGKKISSGIVEHVTDADVKSAEFREYPGGLPKWRNVQNKKAPQGSFSENFRDKLFKLIERSGMKTSEVYRAANSTAKVFSDIRNKENYQPKKQTAISYALALKLSLQETQELLAAAGYTLNDAIEFDSVIINCILRGMYNIIEINFMLFDRNLNTL